jgi:hypothetical protein
MVKKVKRKLAFSKAQNIFPPTYKKALKLSSKTLLVIIRVPKSIARGFAIKIVINKTVQMQLELQNVIKIAFIVFFISLSPFRDHKFTSLPTNQPSSRRKTRINF